MGMVIKNNHILPMMECVGMQMSQKEFEQKTKKQKVLRNEIERVFSKLPTTDIGRHTQEKIASPKDPLPNHGMVPPNLARW